MSGGATARRPSCSAGNTQREKERGRCDADADADERTVQQHWIVYDMPIQIGRQGRAGAKGPCHAVLLLSVSETTPLHPTQRASIIVAAIGMRILQGKCQSRI